MNRTITKKQLLEILDKRCQEAGNQKTFAGNHKISQSHVSDVLQERREPAEKILRALGYERVVVYREVEK